MIPDAREARGRISQDFNVIPSEDSPSSLFARPHTANCCSLAKERHPRRLCPRDKLKQLTQLNR